MKITTVLSAYTGVLFEEFGDVHKYIEQLMERPVYTHEMADKKVMTEIKEKAKSDFLKVIEQIKDIELQ